jgi:hypothetical protein
MWDRRHLATLWASRPVTGIASLSYFYYEISLLYIWTLNYLKTAQRLVKLIMFDCTPLLNYRTSTHIRQSFPCASRLWLIGCWLRPVRFAVLHMSPEANKHWVRSVILGCQRMCPARPIRAFCTWDATFLWHWWERHSWFICFNHCCQRKLKIFSTQVSSCFMSICEMSCEIRTPAALSQGKIHWYPMGMRLGWP